MKKIIYALTIAMAMNFTSCKTVEKKQDITETETVISDEQQDFLGITNKEFLSAASKRALKWPTDLGNE